MSNIQEKAWLGEFGKQYRERNMDLKPIDELYLKATGRTFTSVFKKYFCKLPKSSSVLEVGCNVGLNIGLLQEMGFNQISGIELNPDAAKIAKELHPKVNIINQRIQDFETDKKFDIVFTNTVLTHLNPDTVIDVIRKIISLSKTWIWGSEYFADQLTTVPYRGNSNLIFKRNYMKLFLEQDATLQVFMSEKINYLHEPLTDIVYLIKKPDDMLGVK